ncbi:MAG: hypothetical protein HY063_11755 [Bacteroidetes bacterium]|nr:hypothetical protein [Bacteroidota bacterium]
MQSKIFTSRFLFISIAILAAALFRLLPHPFNFTPVGAMALFGGAYFTNRILAFVVVTASLYLSDLVLNIHYFGKFIFLYDGFYWTYAGFFLIIFIGFWLSSRIKLQNILGASLIASIIFFLVTNFGCWPGSTIYPQTFGGLLACYAAGIPFFSNTIAGDLFYTAVLFGSFELAKRRFPILQAK